MEEARNVHVALPSNGSMDIYPDNKPQLYKIRLAQSIKFNGRWEVALKKIRITYDWYNIPTKTTFTLTIPKTDANGAISEEGPVKEIQTLLGDDKILSYDTVDVQLSNGFYPTVDKVLDHILFKINAVCTKEKLPEPDLTYEYDEIKERVWFRVRGLKLLITVSSDTEDHFNMIGYFSDDLGHIIFPQKAEKAPTITSCPDVFVYTDACGYRPVGDTLARLLDHLPITVKHGETLSHSFNDPTFIPVTQGYINTIEIRLTDDTGKLIPIQSSKVICDLEFKKCGLNL